jgi:hypothetical protein
VASRSRKDADDYYKAVQERLKNVVRGMNGPSHSAEADIPDKEQPLPQVGALAPVEDAYEVWLAEHRQNPENKAPARPRVRRY